MVKLRKNTKLSQSRDINHLNQNKSLPARSTDPIQNRDPDVSGLSHENDASNEIVTGPDDEEASDRSELPMSDSDAK